MTIIQQGCKIELCGKKVYRRVLCRKHYDKFRLSDDFVEVHTMESHGMRNSPTYSTYRAMKSRCFNKNVHYYYRYGGRGITVCLGFKRSFTYFYSIMGDKPSGYSIDRIDNNGNYSCGDCEQCKQKGWRLNCEWQTNTVQAWNKRKMVRNTSGYVGVTRKDKKWCAQIGMLVKGKRANFSLGTFTNKEEAALAYDRAVIFFRGDKAITNIL